MQHYFVKYQKRKSTTTRLYRSLCSRSRTLSSCCHYKIYHPIFFEYGPEQVQFRKCYQLTDHRFSHQVPNCLHCKVTFQTKKVYGSAVSTIRLLDPERDSNEFGSGRTNKDSLPASSLIYDPFDSIALTPK